MGPSISEVGAQEWLPHPKFPSLWALRFKLHCSLSLYTCRMNFLCAYPPPPTLLFCELFAECPIAPREWWALPPQHPELVTWLADPKDSQRAGEEPASCTPESTLSVRLTPASGTELQREGPTLFAQLEKWRPVVRAGQQGGTPLECLPARKFCGNY